MSFATGSEDEKEEEEEEEEGEEKAKEDKRRKSVDSFGMTGIGNKVKFRSPLLNETFVERSLDVAIGLGVG